jgi:flagellar protein FliO/FliZ
MTLWLVVVVLVILAIGWMLRRGIQAQGGLKQHVKVVSSTAVGPRERVVVLEIAGQWTIVGVAPGHVGFIDKLPIPPCPEPSSTPNPSKQSFSERLSARLHT